VSKDLVYAPKARIMEKNNYEKKKYGKKNYGKTGQSALAP